MAVFRFSAARASKESHFRNFGDGLDKRAADTIQAAAENGDRVCEVPVRFVSNEELERLVVLLRSSGYDAKTLPRARDILVIQWGDIAREPGTD